MPRARHPLAWATLTAAAAVVVITFGGFDFMRFTAFANSENCYYNLWRTAPKKIDAVILGSSRMRRGIDPDRLRDKLFGADGVVINFGHPIRDTQMNYLMAKELATKSEIEYLIVEPDIEIKVGTSPDTPEFSHYRQRLEFSPFWNNQALLEEFFSRPSQPKILSFRELLRQVFFKLEYALVSLASGRAISIPFVSKKAVDQSRKNICWLKDYDTGRQSPKRKAKMVKFKEQFLVQHFNWFDPGFGDFSAVLDLPSRERERFYLKKIVDLAKEKNIKLILTTFPDFYKWPPSPEFVEKFERKIGAPLATPGKDVLFSMMQGGFKDQAHLTGPGRAIFTDYLAQQIEQKL